MDLDARWPERGSALTWAPYGPERCCGAFRRYYGALHRASDGPEVLPSNIITINNPLGRITYHILDTPTLFLFSLRNTNKHKAYFNNVQDVIVRKDGITILIVRKWGYPFFNISCTKAATFFIKTQLRRLHRRFGHPCMEQLYQLLKNAGHDNVDKDILEKIQKFCHYC
jgi:hypothetical protein